MTIESVHQTRRGLLDRGEEGPCPIWSDCTDPARLFRFPEMSMTRYYSARAGGVFDLGDLTYDTHVKKITSDQKKKISRYVYDQNKIGDIPILTDTVLEQVFASRETLVEDRVLRLLEFLAHNPGGPATPLSHKTTERGAEYGWNLLMAATESLDDRDVDWLASAGVEGRWVDKRNEEISIKPAGVIHLDERRRGLSRSRQVFVAMWFDGEMREIYDSAIAPSIRAAGYTPYRVDDDHGYDHQITDQIFAQIQQSRFLIADFTHGEGGARGGVYFEAGFARGLGLPIIWSVRKDQEDKLHFDTDHFPHVLWTSADDLRTKLQSKIEGFIGKGPELLAVDQLRQ